MDKLMAVMALVLCVAMIGAALLAIRQPDAQAAKTDTAGLHGLPVAILAAGLVSLLASILFLILAAPDVAMTEAAIGSGLTTFLFFFVLARIRDHAQSGGDGHG